MMCYYLNVHFQGQMANEYSFIQSINKSNLSIWGRALVCRNNAFASNPQANSVKLQSATKVNLFWPQLREQTLTLLKQRTVFGRVSL